MDTNDIGDVNVRFSFAFLPIGKFHDYEWYSKIDCVSTEFMGRKKARYVSTPEMRDLIGSNIRRYRKLAGLDQHELAYLALGYNKDQKNAAQGAVSSLETGEIEPLASELNALARVLTVRMGDFFNNSKHIDPRIQSRLKTLLPRTLPA